VAAMASYLDAKVHHGAWLVRIEDVDETRTVPDAARAILQALQQLGMHWDGEVIWQSQRKHLYQAAAVQLARYTYPCGCTRRELAVVVDDALQGITHVVRGVDLKDSTARQIYLQRLLRQPMPRYLHLPVVRNAQGEKLSKQTGAQPLMLGVEGEEAARTDALIAAAQFLGLPMTRVKSVAQFWQLAQPAWRQLLQRL
jgi:glutamyl/glutaminyl-tRNA synthetase